MAEIINEKISVISVYDRETGISSPNKLKWHGRVYTVKDIGLHYTGWKGRTLMHYYSIVTENNTSMKLSLNSENLHWLLEEVIDEFAT